MNIIEQLGGYEKAKEWVNPSIEAISQEVLKSELLEYRRQHNIFEVGDLVIDTNHKDSNTQEVKSLSGNKIEVFHKNKAYYYATYIFSFRHATDAEIKAGKRL